MAKAELTECLKFKKLQGRLPDCARPLLVGHLDLMWATAWAGEAVAFASIEDAEVAAEWGGEPGRLGAVLLEVGWLVKTDLGLEINDWWEHAPEYVKRRKKMLEIALRRGYQMPDEWLRARHLQRPTGAPAVPQKAPAVPPMPPPGTQRGTTGVPLGNQRGTGGNPTVPKTHTRPDQDQESVAGSEGGGPGEGGKGAEGKEQPPAGAGGDAGPELNLTPSGDDAPKKGTAGRKRQRGRNPDVSRLIAHYHDEFKRTKGSKPLIDDADAAAAVKVLAGRSFEEASRLVTRFLESPDEWTAEHGLLRLRDLPAAVTKLLAKAAPTGGNGKGRRDATGAPLPVHDRDAEDTIELDGEGVERHVRIFRSTVTGEVVERRWGRALHEKGEADGPDERGRAAAR